MALNSLVENAPFGGILGFFDRLLGGPRPDKPEALAKEALKAIVDSVLGDKGAVMEIAIRGFRPKDNDTSRYLLELFVVELFFWDVALSMRQFDGVTRVRTRVQQLLLDVINSGRSKHGAEVISDEEWRRLVHLRLTEYSPTVQRVTAVAPTVQREGFASDVEAFALLAAKNVLGGEALHAAVVLTMGRHYAESL